MCGHGRVPCPQLLPGCLPYLPVGPGHGGLGDATRARYTHLLGMPTDYLVLYLPTFPSVTAPAMSLVVLVEVRLEAHPNSS